VVSVSSQVAFVTLAIQKVRDPSQVLIQFFDFAFPNDQYVPPQFTESFYRPSISIDIGAELVLPEFDIGLGRRGITAIRMPMPKTTVDEYDLPAGREYQVRSSG
jgi:hypothetical protein